MVEGLFSLKGCYIYQLPASSSGLPEVLRAGVLQLPPGPLVLGLAPHLPIGGLSLLHLGHNLESWD